MFGGRQRRSRYPPAAPGRRCCPRRRRSEAAAASCESASTLFGGRRRSEAAASRRVRCSAAVKGVPATRPPSDALRVTRARCRRTKVTEIDQRNEGHHRNTHVPDERVQRVLHARVQRVQKQENSKRAPTTRAAVQQTTENSNNKTQKNEKTGKIPAKREKRRKDRSTVKASDCTSTRVNYSMVGTTMVYIGFFWTQYRIGPLYRPSGMSQKCAVPTKHGV